ncbi:N-acetyl-alpha-D-glucosaminyl L-malate synthase BshA [Shewanella waksmanii]|uniref:N-acetyl-alpha-D-glucosaminyl L-malate synthase BshA n=1 Tax=Shewanella waksmanii TaxID=213783 RepID=UPI003735868B
MRIGIVCHPSIGGSGLVATQLGLGIAKLGHEVHFISRTRPFKLLEDLDNVFFHSVEAIHYPLFTDPLYTFALTAKIVEVAEQYQLDVVHAHYSIPHSLCAYLAGEISQRKFPTITTIHGTDVTVIGQDKPLYPLNQFSINKSDKVTTVSAFQRDYIRQNFDIDNPIEVIHNFIDLSVFSPDNASKDVRRTLAHDDEKIIMHVSNFRAIKNTQAVVHSFNIVQQQLDVRLVLLGSGPDIDGLKVECQRLGILDKVSFLGDVTHVESYLANADCVIQPSYKESFSLVVLEAMASAVPTVTSNVDGIPEVMQDGETGLMADPDDIAGLAEHTVTILSDADLQQKMGRAGRLRAAELFNPEDKIAQYLTTYREAIAQFQASHS